MLKRRTPSRTDLEKWDPEEIEDMFGTDHLIESIIKSQEPHDSSRSRRNRAREEAALAKKAERQKYPKR